MIDLFLMAETKNNFFTRFLQIVTIIITLKTEIFNMHYAKLSPPSEQILSIGIAEEITKTINFFAKCLKSV